MSSKKVFYLIEHWLPPGTPGSTGGTLYNYQLITEISQIFDVEVIALHAPVRTTPNGVKLTTFHESRDLVRRWRFANWRADLMRQIPLNGERNLLITTTATNAILKEAKARGFSTLAIIQAFEDFGLEVPGGRFAERIQGLKSLLATAQGLQPQVCHADRVIVNSKYMKQAVAENLSPSLNISVLYPPLNLSLNPKPIFTPDALRRVGFVNRAGKNLPFVAELARATPDREFIIYGHPFKEPMQLPTNLIVRGWASNRAQMYSEAATWIMPSSWSEPFGLVAIEALSQGCRVGVSNRGGLPEAVGSEGRIFNNFDIAEWRTWLKSNEKLQFGDSRKHHLQAFTLSSFRHHAVKLLHEV